MRTCQQCGLSIGDTALFCPVCSALVASEGPAPTAEPQPSPPGACALCHSPGPLTDVESFRLCKHCRSDLELLVDHEPPADVTIHVLTAGGDVRRSLASTDRLDASEVGTFLEYAVKRILPATAQAVARFHEESRAQGESSRRA